MNLNSRATKEGGHSASDPSDSPREEIAYPRRNINQLYCPAITYRCASGALPRHGSHAAGQGEMTPCVPCAYKICNFEIALDSEFTKRVPNQRPEQCHRSPRASSGGRPDQKDMNNYDDLDGTMGYRRGMNVLTIGDGDFTFSLAVAHLVVRGAESKNNINHPGMVVATSYEDSQTLRKVYPDFDKTLDSLNCFGKSNVVIGYNVDATRLDSTLPKELQSKNNLFHRICWNFPCSAVKSGQDGQNDAMEQNKELVRKFVANALPYLDEECGEIHMAHKTKPPYNQWGLEKVALEGINRSKGVVNNGGRQFEFKGRVTFDKCTYRGYTPRKALDRKSFPCHDACIYVFGWKSHDNVVGDNSSSKLKSSRIRHSTIPEDELEDSNDKTPKPSSVIPVTESVIDKVRSTHLQNAERRAGKQHNKRNFWSSKGNNGTRNKQHKKS